ncbi:MAG: chorismate synthase [Spirochaetales bacterium]|nr:chorismate synthase [Spirochaetales bacterium]
MGANTFGTIFRVTTFGESHGPALGAVLDGVPPRLPLTTEDIQKDLDRRKPGGSPVSTPRKEEDRVEILSGVFEGFTTGTPLALLIRNRDARPEAYDELKDLFRPSHADRTYLEKYGIRDHRGGGRASGRETAARVAAGAVAKKFLSLRGISLRGYTLEAGGIRCASFDERVIDDNPLYAPDSRAAEKMLKTIGRLAEEGDSAGGIVECRITGCPAGLGEPVFDKLDADLAKAMLSIGSVKGVEFGSGFACALMRGSGHNDKMNASGYLSNNAGGILGGISTGQDILFRIAVKPTPSIRLPQATVDTSGSEREISIQGRHDACICPRIVPVVEAMAALVLADHLLRSAASISLDQTE